MKEQLISFETAKLAKEKGFTLQSNPFGYMTKFYNHNTRTLLSYGRTGRTDLNKAYYAPTQSLLQKWLREVHDISIKIDDYYINSKVRFDYNVCELGSQEDNPVGIFETYEEALESGLQEALKLLKTK